MKTLRRLLALLLFGAAFVLAYRLAGANELPITVDLLFVRTSPTELWIVLVAAAGVGAVLASAILLFELARVGLLARRYRKTVTALEAEVHELRNLPLEVDEGGPRLGAADEPGLATPAGGSAQGSRG